MTNYILLHPVSHVNIWESMLLSMDTNHLYKSPAVLMAAYSELRKCLLCLTHWWIDEMAGPVLQHTLCSQGHLHGQVWEYQTNPIFHHIWSVDFVCRQNRWLSSCCDFQVLRGKHRLFNSLLSLPLRFHLNGDLKIIILQWETGLKRICSKESIQGNRLIHEWISKMRSGSSPVSLQRRERAERAY